MRKVGKFSRGVSIIGVGCTPFTNTLKNPETMGLTESELFGYAAIEAMNDAGISPKQIQAYFHGQGNPIHSSDHSSANVQVNDWFGTRGLGSYAHSEACCTGYAALDLAVQSVASGKYDFVLTGCVEMGLDNFVPGMPAHYRKPFTTAEFAERVSTVYDRAYTRHFAAGAFMQFDDFIAEYIKENNLTSEQIDDVLNILSVTFRRNAVNNPLAYRRVSFEDLAKQAGFDDVMDYMRSPDYNPKLSQFLRKEGMEARADAAAACIVCPTELAYQFKQKPIEVIGVGNCVLDAIHPHMETVATKIAVDQAYEFAGITADEVDLLLCQDFFLSSVLLGAEVSSYIPKGQAWKYIMDGRVAIDGDKPMNTNGGRCQFGHAHAASGLADVYEAVKQMRGQAGVNQLKTPPKTTMLRGFGGGQNICVEILRTAE